MMRPTQADARRMEIARLDAVSRTRVLTDGESRRLEQLIYRDRHVKLAGDRRAAARRRAA